MLERHGHGGGGLDVGVFEDDEGGVAAQLHGGGLHVQAGHRGQLLAHRHRAGEGHLADDGRGNQVGRDLGRAAEHQVEHAGGQARVREAAHQLDHRGGRVFRALDDDGAARGQRAGNLAHGLIDGEVPGREGGHRADGLAHH
ncbi:hypothetical protein D3C71_1501110 [compost metagenome]